MNEDGDTGVHRKMKRVRREAIEGVGLTASDVVSRRDVSRRLGFSVSNM